MASPIVHRFQASLLPVNAYLLEFPDGIVVVDSTLGVTDGRALRARVDATGKPLHGVIATHTHPDHYGGLTGLVEGSEAVPIFAVQASVTPFNGMIPRRKPSSGRCSATNGRCGAPFRIARSQTGSG